MHFCLWFSWIWEKWELFEIFMICSRVLWHQCLYFLLGIQSTLCTYKNRPLLLIWGLRVTLGLFCFQRQKFPCHSITCATNHFFWLFTALIKSSRVFMFAFRAIHARESSIEEVLWDSFFIGWQLGLHIRVFIFISEARNFFYPRSHVKNSKALNHRSLQFNSLSSYVN